MNEHRKTLADLFVRLHGMGVESAAPWPSCGFPDCPPCEMWWTENKVRVVGEVIGEMFGRDNQGITEADVLDAAKKAGVY